MSIVSDINELNKYRKYIPTITTKEDLQQIITESRDLVNGYANDVKGLGNALGIQVDFLDNISFFSNNTDDPSEYEKIIFNNAKEESVLTIEEAEKRLNDKIIELNDSNKNFEYEFFIEDIGIKFLLNPNPSFSANAVSTPIVTEELQDFLNEDVEINNPLLSFKIFLEGKEMDNNYKKLLEYMNKKQRIKLVLNKVYEDVVITSIDPNFDGAIDTLEVDMNFEKLFIATLKRTAEPIEVMKTPQKKVTKSGKQGTKETKFKRSYYQSDEDLGRY